MKVVSVALKEFKGIDVDLRWASAVVLFGPNDSGKTNILEALAFLFTSKASGRVDRYAQMDEPDPPDAEVIVELDGLDIAGNGAQEFFVRWLGGLLPFWDADALDAARTLVAAVPEADDRAAALDAVVVHYRDVARQVKEQELRTKTDAEESDIALVAEAMTRSNRFRVSWDEIQWLAPPREALSDAVQGALTRLEASAHQDDRLDSERLIDVGGDGGFDGLVRVLRFEFDQRGLGDLHRALEGFVDREMARRENVSFNFTGGPVPLDIFIERWRFDPRGRRDIWLQRTGDSVSLHPLVHQVCADLSERTTELAPAFITRQYEIVIQPHTPDEWRRLGYRASVRLRPRRLDGDADGTFDLAVASTGVATWTGYAVAEAMRVYDEKGARAAGTDHGSTVFLLDEPERHLHPLAQREIAAWIAARASTGAHAIIATHAPPFLQLPLEDVEYYMVGRGRDRQTGATRITGEIADAVTGSAAELGISPATLIQLTRAWLFVEGEHDRLILDTFFRHDLRNSWVEVVAFRGAARAKASFVTLHALRPLGTPYFVLLDNVRAGQVNRGEIPTGQTEEERIAAELIHLMRDEPGRLTIKGLSCPDVICLLPPEAIRRGARELGQDGLAFEGWDELVEAHARHRAATAGTGGKTDIKQFLIETLGLKGRIGIDEFLAHVIAAVEPHERPHPELERIVTEVTAATTSQPGER